MAFGKQVILCYSNARHRFKSPDLSTEPQLFFCITNATHAPPVDDMEPNATKLADQRASEEAWASLIGEIASGDQEALGTLYDASSSMVYGLALRIVSNTATAEEVTLDVYTQVWRQAATYDTKRGAPSAWLITLTRSRAIDRLRSRAHDRPALAEQQPQPEAGATPEETTALTERRRLVQEACAQLPPEQRQVLELSYFSGLSHHEIARELDLPAGTVKTRIRLGIKKLRELLQPLVDS